VELNELKEFIGAADIHIRPYLNEAQESLQARARDGHVPNVVYSCGRLVRNRQVVIPHALSDYASTFATASLDEVPERME
jgi:hypothetical protein